MPRTRSPGFETKTPEKECGDKNCPFHGTLKARGRQFTGKVVSDKMQKSVIVEWVGWRYIPKYERYKRTRTKIVAHNPTCINAKEGDMVNISECRPLSKRKNFVILGIIGKLEKYALEKEAREEGKHRIKAKEEASAERAEKEKEAEKKAEKKPQEEE
jgi:small subunit ribosomal protein S17